MAQYMYELKIPKARIAVLIGKSGEVKRQIEAETSTKMSIDSEEGDVSLTAENGLDLYSAREVVKAIGRGFNPNVALLLLKGDHLFEVIDLSAHAATKNRFTRLKGRIIGTEGKSRRLIEELTECHLSIYGKTIGIIGEPDNVVSARKAIEMLVKGSMHSTVYRWLEKRRKQIKGRHMI